MLAMGLAFGLSVVGCSGGYGSGGDDAKGNATVTIINSSSNVVNYVGITLTSGVVKKADTSAGIAAGNSKSFVVPLSGDTDCLINAGTRSTQFATSSRTLLSIGGTYTFRYISDASIGRVQ
jgi:uncharacterized membrane protein